MDLHQFNKEHYFYEANRRHQLTGALAIPVGVLTVLGGALLVIAKDLDSPLDSMELTQLVLIVVSALMMGVTIFYLVRSYFNYSYGYIATSKELNDYFNGLVEFYSQNGGTQHDAEEELEKYVNSEYASHTHINTANNDRKSYYIHKANGFLIASLVFVILSGLPYVAKSVVDGSEVQKIQIVNLNSQNTGVQAMSNEPKSEPTKQQSPPPVVKPSPPPGRIIKESEEPKKVK